jgi:hypothetical protein
MVTPVVRGVLQPGTVAAMDERWKTRVRVPVDVEGVPFGPSGDYLPARFDVIAEAMDRPLRVLVAATFDGVHRVCARSVLVERTDGESVAPEDVIGTQLATVMVNAIRNRAIRYGGKGGTLMKGGRVVDGPPSDDELCLLARMYWLEYVAWGKPRQAVMSAFELPRSTANAWIRKARDKYGLPGLHAEDGR